MFHGEGETDGQTWRD